MIHFALRCRAGGHDFDGWFRSGEDFEARKARALVSCPVCGAHEVEKALMRPAVSTREAQGQGSAVPVASAPEGEAHAAFRQLMELAREMRRTGAYVGPRFAEEARRMHFGEAEAKPIWGEASGEEVRALAEEGVWALPLPRLPEDGH